MQDLEEEGVISYEQMGKIGDLLPDIIYRNKGSLDSACENLGISKRIREKIKSFLDDIS